ncbi:PWWP domain [Acrodontium crateriforme]|uniref:PWWP domain n=1 Tax=Acrodontium crateriforme TaxID=150365 RepID=A0AAQ3M9H4_9PEZI|nr:PWWP domain [Acrodontium crateriforme]
MAEAVAAPVAVEAPAFEPVAAPATEPVEANGETEATKPDEETASKEAAEVNAAAGETTGATDPVKPTEATTSTPASSKKEKRKSGAGVSEHKGKTLGKKKSMPILRLDCKPGDFYWARLKGFPPWPAIICDEQMLPESLLASRPVSAARPDGSLREDFQENGKNAKERTFPVMFLSTNEFSWMANTALSPLDPDECTTMPKGKMTKALGDAYRLASEGHDINYYKGLLKQWQEDEKAIAEEQRELEAEAERKAQEKAEKKAAAEKKKSRKSKGGDDVAMEDVNTPKSTKKRKKDAESDAEGAKPKKTPKVTKLNGPKTPNGEPSSVKATPKPKKKVTAPKDSEEDKPEMSEAEKLVQREKAVLYLRHRLQKGFLSRDHAPLESEMANMADFFTQLEAYENLEPAIIRTTKVHKVLKAIVKLTSVPKDQEFNFKKRSAALLENWNRRMESEVESAPAAKEGEQVTETEKAPEANGIEKPEATVESNENSETKVESAADGAQEAIVSENTAKTSTTEVPAVSAEYSEAKKEDADVSMTQAPTESA